MKVHDSVIRQFILDSEVLSLLLENEDAHYDRVPNHLLSISIDDPDLSWERVLNEVNIYIKVLESKLNRLYASKNGLVNSVIRYRSVYKSYLSVCKRFLVVAINNPILDLCLNLEYEYEYKSGGWCSEDIFKLPIEPQSRLSYLTNLTFNMDGDYPTLIRNTKSSDDARNFGIQTLYYLTVNGEYEERRFKEISKLRSLDVEATIEDTIGVHQMRVQYDEICLPVSSSIQLDGQCVH